jgi:hypothetical protein
MKTTYYVIAISYGQNTEYWNSSLVNDENTTENPEGAEGFETIVAAQKELENAVKPFGIEKGWNVSYSIDEF